MIHVCKSVKLRRTGPQQRVPAGPGTQFGQQRRPGMVSAQCLRSRSGGDGPRHLPRALQLLGGWRRQEDAAHAPGAGKGKGQAHRNPNLRGGLGKGKAPGLVLKKVWGLRLEINTIGKRLAKTLELSTIIG